MNIVFRIFTIVCIPFLLNCTTSQTESGTALEAEDYWPNAVFYEIFVQAFYDSDGDGIGDINGMTAKLDYLKDLGIHGIWLMPISPSPSYHKYDVTDYKDIHPDYGTLDDFKKFIKEAHARDIKVIVDLVVNHSSSDHPWFKAAVADKNSPYRDYYVWANRDSVADEIAKKEITLDSDNINQWHDAAGNDEVYYGFFIAGMPDLNYDNPKVRQEIFDIGKFWLNEVGIDGFRLDAARHIFPDERAADNHAWWIQFRQEMMKAKPDVFLVGEVWADAETVAPYMAGLNALFNFDLGYAITKTVQQENDSSLIQRLKEIRDFYQSVNPEFIDATFLTNHDQNRIMSVLDDNENKERMAAALLLTLPGAPFIYYGEEIGMEGMKPDEHIREPFVWEPGDAKGEARWIEPTYSTEEKVVPASVQIKEEQSLLNFYKTLIHTRDASPILSLGQLDTTGLNSPGLSSFYRIYQSDTLLVIHNLSNEPISFDRSEAINRFPEVYFTTSESFSVNTEQPELPPYSTVILSK